MMNRNNDVFSVSNGAEGSGDAKAAAAQWGRAGERIAEEYLLTHGYVVRERNWSPRNSHLEIDLIAQHEDEIVFVEVKTRTEDVVDPAEAVNSDKIRKLVRGANRYLQSLECDFYYRFDVITIVGTPEHYTLDHLVDAFLPPITGGRG